MEFSSDYLLFSAECDEIFDATFFLNFVRRTVNGMVLSEQ